MRPILLFAGLVMCLSVAKADEPVPNPLPAAPAPAAHTTGPAPLAQPLEASDDEPNSLMPRLSLGATSSSYRGHTLTGADLSFLVHIDPESPVYAGIETGFQYYSTSGLSPATGAIAKQSLSVVPILMTVLYRFDLDPVAHPYLGVAAGVGLLTFDHNDAWLDNQGSRTKFNGLLRAGFELQVTPGASLNFEPRYGVLGSYGYFNPTIGITLGY